MYGPEIPLGKGEDDGSVFSSFLKESRLPDELRSVSWEEIRDVLQVYKVRFSCRLVLLGGCETENALWSLFRFM